MNYVRLALDHVTQNPDRPAIWLPGLASGKTATFADLFALSCALQRSLATSGVASGDLVLLQDRLSVRLYAAVFERSADYHSTAFGNLEQFLDRTEADYQAALANGFRFRKFDWSRLLAGEAAALYRLTNQAFEDSFLFETAPQPLFDLFIGTLGKPVLDCTHFAVSPQGVDVGFFYAFTDRHSPSPAADPETYIVLKSTGVTKEARGQGLSNALAHLSVKSGLAKGAQYCIAALVRSGLLSESYARKGDLFWQHNYTLFEKRL